MSLQLSRRRLRSLLNCIPDQFLMERNGLRWYNQEPWKIIQFSSVTQLCPTRCNLMDCSMPGLSVHLQLPELTQNHVQRVGDAIQPSHPLSSPSPPAFNLFQLQSLFPMSQFFASGGQSNGVSVSAAVLPMNIQD